MKQVAAREAISLLRSMTRVLCVVGILALVSTTVNVTRFATSRDIPLPIAVLLDPMIGTALAGVLYVDARLAAWGINPPTWSMALRWGTGSTAALMNTWDSLWPDGRIGWPRQADPAAVLLHLTPALLLIALTETIAAYRRTVTDLLETIGAAELPDPPATATHRSAPERSAPPASPSPAPLNALKPAARSAPKSRPIRVAAASDGGRAGLSPGKATRRPHDTLRSADDDVWPLAIALDNASRTATGRPVSIWKLRTALRIGPRRARQIREQLLVCSPDPAPDPPETDRT